jgi:hypothetical protein
VEVLEDAVQAAQFEVVADAFCVCQSEHGVGGEWPVEAGECFDADLVEGLEVDDRFEAESGPGAAEEFVEVAVKCGPR